MLILQTHTPLSPAEVVERAKEFFATRFSPAAAFVADESESHVCFRFDVGELVIGAHLQQDGDRTLVRGSTSRLHNALSQFLTTISTPESIQQNLLGPGASGAG